MVANPILNTTSFVVVGDKGSVSVTNVIKTKQYNVVGYRWVLQCIERKAYDFPPMQHVSERDGKPWVGGGGRVGFLFVWRRIVLRLGVLLSLTDDFPPLCYSGAEKQRPFVFTDRRALSPTKEAIIVTGLRPRFRM